MLVSRQSKSHPYDPLEDLRVLEVCKEVEATWALPSIYYTICAHITLRTLSEEFWSKVDASEKLALFRGVLLHVRKAAESLSPFLNHTQALEKECTDANCVECRVDVRNRFINSSDDVLQDFLTPRLSSGQLCAGCTKRFRRAVFEANEWRQHQWRELPELYGLPPWEDLGMVRREDLKLAEAESR